MDGNYGILCRRSRHENVLTETCSAGEVRLVEVFVVDGDGLDECGAHAHHGLAILAPAKNREIASTLEIDSAVPCRGREGSSILLW